MILKLAATYQRLIAAYLLLFFSLSFLSPLYAGGITKKELHPSTTGIITPHINKQKLNTNYTKKPDSKQKPSSKLVLQKGFTSGPSQPEMSTFKPVDATNLVNLFTGDFSYNIPLMDVGGYPINIFYDGGITMEQEASWVGLGWNINPGSITRNMRGVPDDFDGTETLTQTQLVKPNITFGVNLDANTELLGIKKVSLQTSLGLAFNNYLGPSISLGASGGFNLFSIMGAVNTEKNNKNESDTLGLNFATVKVTATAKLDSRAGLTLSPNISLSANSFLKDKGIVSSVGLSASYNSRVGLKDLEIYDQMSVNKTREKQKSFYDRVDVYNSNLASTTITFARPSYLPTLRMPITNNSGSGRYKAGGGIFGGYGSLAAEVYKQESDIEDADMEQDKPLIGYLNYDKINNNPNAVTDFTRLNDREVTANTPIISAPQYTYDVFSIQGEGTGGTFRAYRNDIGYVRDNLTTSKDKSNAAGIDVGPPGHYGANFDHITTPTTIGEWNSGNHLRSTVNTNFTTAKSNDLTENVYFRNPGENSIVNSQQYDKIGGTNLVRFELGGTNNNPSVEPSIQQFSSSGKLISTTSLNVANDQTRKKRTQVISYLNADEARVAGLDKTIKNYDATTILDADNNLKYDNIERVDNINRLINHISEIDVLEGNGKRYVYGIPVYNLKQVDFSFSVSNTESSQEPGKVTINSIEPKPTNPFVNPPYKDPNKDPNDPTNIKDGYYQTTQTPAYAHSFLLTGILSSDYVDVNNDGITEDDLGTAVKFNYTKINSVYKWRTPLKLNRADFNEGLITEAKDDKGMISYGERESWYLHSVESKTMIAVFSLADRDDAKGTSNPYTGGVNQNDKALKQLKQIDLYNKSDLKRNGLSKAKPIKTVHFEYDYSLCKKAPGNISSANGKLTLKEIWFSYNGQERATNRSHYLFSYEKAGIGNPDYAPASSDRWGTYKPASQNPQGIKNAYYPYPLQDWDAASTTAIKQNAGAWMLKSIVLPSGGQMDVDYESDDYAFIQNKRATSMLTIAGFGSTNNVTQLSKNLYENVQTSDASFITENNYVFINIPQSLQSTTSSDIKNEILKKYLDGVGQLAFKLSVTMPKGGNEFITCYANFDNYGRYGTAQSKTIWIHLVPVNGSDGISPLSLTAAEFLREQLPGQAFVGYDVSGGTTLQQIGQMAAGLLSGITGAFTSPLQTIRGDGNAKIVNVNQSFVRLNDPDGFKYGGGYRVKSVKLYDNWDKMTGQYASVYGQAYSYTTTEIFDGQERTISSGVASYEPQIGGEENPFQTIVQVKDKLPLGPTSYGAIEMPVLDAFFSAPVVGYSKVTVRSIKNNVGASEANKIRSGIGKQVTEFYTAKDFPVYYSYTPIDPASEKSSHVANSALFFYKFSYDSRALSQGFLVATNDMHGKIKAQFSYAENDENTPISYTKYYYRNTGSKGLDEKFDFVDASQGGIIVSGNMGIDIEMMNDLREFSVKSNSYEIQGQLDQFPILGGLPWIPFIWPVAGNTENTYRAVTTTKVINYHSILENVEAMDKGSIVSTKNILYDSETGDVLLTSTNNEFDKPVYNLTYPAWWAYSGMGPAYKNIDAIYKNIKFSDGKITTAMDMSVFESGDELLILSSENPTTGCDVGIASSDQPLIWAFDQNKQVTSLTTTPNFLFIDSTGKPYTKANVSFRIIRSGKHNQLNAIVAAVSSMISPVITDPNNSSQQKLSIGINSQVIKASAVEYKEKWQTDKGTIRTLKFVPDDNTCTSQEIDDCAGYLEKSINPYRKGLIGNFKQERSMVFYGNRVEKNPIASTNISQNGFLENFKLYWDFNSANNLVPDFTNMQWVWNNESTRYNAQGFEIENKNALNVYSMAQYGFKNTLPVAAVNNSNYQAAAYDGFEDDNYSNKISINTPVYCTNRQHINFSDLGTVIKASDAGFNAHTGKYVLQVTNNGANQMFQVGDNNVTDFNLQFTPAITKHLDQVGGNVIAGSCDPGYTTTSNPQTYLEQQTTFNNGGFSTIATTSNNSTISDNKKTFTHSLNFSINYYIQVLQSGDYWFRLTATGNESALTTEDQTSFSITIKDINNQNKLQENASGSDLSPVYTKHLCPGIYLISSIVSDQFSYTTTNLNQNEVSTSYKFGIATNAAGIDYKSLSTQDGCSYTVPIAAQETMQHSTFTILSNKKMLFSAWVREKCGNPQNGVPCKLTSYSNNKIQIFDENGILIKELVPTGAIIDGWQRYEGDFTVIQGSKALLKIVNLSGNPIYLDDIRMHPFNAMMKSYVYDDINLRLVAEMDENNYARFYEYDEEGTLIRTKAETREGIKTLTETRSATANGITQTDH